MVGQKPALFRNLGSWFLSTKGAISLTIGQRDKWLPAVPMNTPKHMLALGFVTITDLINISEVMLAGRLFFSPPSYPKFP